MATLNEFLCYLPTTQVLLGNITTLSLFISYSISARIIIVWFKWYAKSAYNNFSISKFLLLFLGIPTYFVGSLLEMSDWGGTDAESLKKGIDNIFMDDGNIPVAQYRTKLVPLNIDEANVNTGHISGLMTRFAANREWLVKIHCINHLVELAV